MCIFFFYSLTLPFLINAESRGSEEGGRREARSERRSVFLVLPSSNVQKVNFVVLSGSNRFPFGSTRLDSNECWCRGDGEWGRRVVILISLGSDLILSSRPRGHKPPPTTRPPLVILCSAVQRAFISPVSPATRTLLHLPGSILESLTFVIEGYTVFKPSR